MTNIPLIIKDTISPPIFWYIMAFNSVVIDLFPNSRNWLSTSAAFTGSFIKDIISNKTGGIKYFILGSLYSSPFISAFISATDISFGNGMLKSISSIFDLSVSSALRIDRIISMFLLNESLIEEKSIFDMNDLDISDIY